MSQEKVERYKLEKANRKAEMKKKKLKKVLRNTLFSLVGVALVGWIGYSAYGKFESSRPHEEVTVDYTAVQDYLNGLSE